MAPKLFLAAALAGMAGAASAAADPARYMSAELIAQTASPRPGTTILVGFRMVPKPGWHGYWSNPGDAGLVPTVKWSAPQGVRLGPLLHPAPQLISADGINSYVHEGPHILLSRMTISPSVTKGTRLPVRAELNWAACTATQCVPLKANFSLDLVAGDGAPDSNARALRLAEMKLPRQVAGGGFWSDGKLVTLSLPQTLRLDPRRARFFPDENGLIESSGGSATRSAEGLRIVARSVGAIGGTLTGVVSDGRNAYRLSLRREEPKTAAKETASPKVAPAQKQAADEPAPLPESHEPSAVAPSRDSAVAHWRWLVLAAALVAGTLLFLRRARRAE